MDTRLIHEMDIFQVVGRLNLGQVIIIISVAVKKSLSLFGPTLSRHKTFIPIINLSLVGGSRRFPLTYFIIVTLD